MAVSYRTFFAGAVLAMILAPAGASPPAPMSRPARVGADGKPHHHSLTDIPDMSKAVPASRFDTLPSSQARYNALKGQVDAVQPKLERARTASDTLEAETARLQQQLIATAARVQQLEMLKQTLGQQIAQLSARQRQLASSFAHDRVAVAQLLALLERMQHDQPPVLAVSAQDALVSARQSMLLGASLPRLYGAAAALAHRLDRLRRTRADLMQRRAQSAQTAAALSQARRHLDQLLATKEGQADTAAQRYETLAAKYTVIARQAQDLGQLLSKVARLRAAAHRDPSGLAMSPGLAFTPRQGALERPVVGRAIRGGIAGVGGARAPGLTFLTAPDAEVVAPADARILFAGPYHRTGQVLILELGDGYDLVLAGLGKVSVRVGDGVLAGEPLGTMRGGNEQDQLYVELRQGQRAMSPLPWLEIGLRKAKKS